MRHTGYKYGESGRLVSVVMLLLDLLNVELFAVRSCRGQRSEEMGEEGNLTYCNSALRFAVV